MKVFRSLQAWKEEVASLKANSASLGFIPTMGALHEGHLSLARRSRAENDRTAVSIFVNPTQFNDKKDFEKYPIHTERDLKLLEEQKVDYVLLPQYGELYADQYEIKVTESPLSRELCGAFRPGHFDGVLTVVAKLLNAARADRAYFGEKDYQQYLLIEKMSRALFIPTTIVPGPTLREENGLAMSSRNERLSGEERRLAAELYAHISSSRSDLDIFRSLTKKGFRVEYVKSAYGRRFIAAHLGAVRLIDNVASDHQEASRQPRILITSGATREYIDSVRFISNVSSGKTGSTIAEHFARWGYPVTYLHGEGAALPDLQIGSIEPVEFKDLRSLDAGLQTLLKKNFDVIIHAAAVSDFGIDRVNGNAPSLHHKMHSQNGMTLDLKVHKKILNEIRDYSTNKNIFVVAFKLTASGDPSDQEERIQRIENQAAPDLLVHNDLNEISRLEHHGSILEKAKSLATFHSKRQLAEELFKILALKEIL